MHINNWVHASDLMKMIKSANGISTLSSEEGLPDNHVITIRERELTVDFPELIQNNIKTDTVTLDLDAEWDGIQPVIIFGPNASGTIAVEYTGEPVHIPGAVMEYVGGLDCSVMGLDDSGEVRLVTKAAPNTFEVVESGEYIGQISEDDVSLLGRILSAIKDVETATSDASSAAEAATDAANSANTAATKATNAANSANTAATKATDAANSANTASERAENAYDALTPIIAEIGVNGNQPRATTNPNHVATASDAYAAKPLEICIKGNTRQNLWVNPSGTSNGLTVTSNEDGSVTLSGTATSNNIWVGYKQRYVLRPGSAYTLSVDNALPSGTAFRVEPRDADGAAITGFTLEVTGSKKTDTATLPSNTAYVNCLFYSIAPVGTTFSGTYRIMLNEGSTAEPWCPPGLNSIDELSLVTAGKNLLARMGDSLPHTTAGITFSDNGDGGIRISGTATASAYYNFFSYSAAQALRITPGEYTVSLIGGGSGLNLIVEYYYGEIGGDRTSWLATNVPGVSSTGSIDRPVYLHPLLKVAKGKTVDTVVYPQLELGSTATAYEPPAVTTTPVDLDGHALNSLPDGTCDELTIDATGAVTLTKRVGVSVIDGTEPGFVYTANPSSRIGAAGLAPGIRSPASNHLNRCDTLPCTNVSNSPNAMATYQGGYVDIRCEQQITSLETGKAWLAANHTTLLYPLATPQTIPLPAVTLPTLPSPNITVYSDSDVPSDITVESERDINIAFEQLAKQIAGTASAVAVREASTIEEE